MAFSEGRVNLEVKLITFHDDDLPGSNIVDSRNPASFSLTTGGFPHEVILGTRASSAKVSKVTIILNEAKDIALDKCTTTTTAAAGGGAFEVIAERSLPRGNENAVDPQRRKGAQVETFQLDPNGSGKDITALRLRILSGYSEFVGIYGVEVLGEESVQRVAVLESKPEVNM